MAIPFVRRISSPGRMRSGDGKGPGFRFSQHLPDYNRAFKSKSNLGMAAAEGYFQILAGPRNLVEDRFHLWPVRLSLGEKQRGQKPAGRSAHDRDVVGIDLHRIPADIFGREGDGVGFGDQIPVAEGNNRRRPYRFPAELQVGDLSGCAGKAGRQDPPSAAFRAGKKSCGREFFSFSCCLVPGLKRAKRDGKCPGLWRISGERRVCSAALLLNGIGVGGICK